MSNCRENDDLWIWLGKTMKENSEENTEEAVVDRWTSMMSGDLEE